MAFDRTDPADLLALKNEVNNDPIGMGYAAIVDQTALLLKLLNDPDNNVNNDTAARDFTAQALLDALDPRELDSAQTEGGAAQYAHMLIELAAYSDISSYKTKFRGMFAGNSATVTALDAQTKDLSRAEVLFGTDTTISRDDWIAARDS